MNRFVLPAIALALVLPLVFPTASAAADVGAIAPPECNATTVRIACAEYEDGTVTVCYEQGLGNLDPPPPVCKSIPVGKIVRPISGCFGNDLVCYTVSGTS
ncbi:MAG TPA: hypothetical protein VNZ52_11805, partial [Candidatus Thermoplasmatota archaeon]|nr:hypothetical protein [Candidatus Thermoplasmatota archaeon]